VVNKIDRLPADEADIETIRRRLGSDAGGHASARVVAVSASTGVGIDRLLAATDEALPLDPLVRATFHLPAGDGATLALLHEFGRVLATHYTGEDCQVEAEIPESLNRRLEERRSG
jgi:GTP-binding protein HflX